MQKAKAIYDLFIFDFDGTLADSRSNIANSLNFSLQQKKLAPVAKEKIYPTIGRLALQETFLFFYPELSSDTVNALTAIYRKRLLAKSSEEIKLFPAVKKTLQKLTEKNKKLAMLTTKQEGTIIKLLESLSLLDYFDFVHGEGTSSYAKPDKKCIAFITEKIDKTISSEKIVMVGDTQIDIATAKNAGIDSLGVAYGIDGEKKLLASGATQIVGQLEEILQFA